MVWTRPPPWSPGCDVCEPPGAGQREQRFGEPLRDQLNRRIAQLDDRATIARVTLVNVLLGGSGNPPPGT
jgi:hypothetical protein